MWSITHRLEKPTASATAAVSASRAANGTPSELRRNDDSCRPKRSRVGAWRCRAAAASASTISAGTISTGSAVCIAVEAFADDPHAHLVAGGQLGGEHLGRHGPGPGPVAGPAHLRRTCRTRRRGRAPRCCRATARYAARRSASRPSVSTTVSSRRAQAAVHDEIEDLEGVGAGPLVVGREADRGPQGVR